MNLFHISEDGCEISLFFSRMNDDLRLIKSSKYAVANSVEVDVDNRQLYNMSDKRLLEITAVLFS